MQRSANRICSCLLTGVLLVLSQSGCSMARMQQQMSQFWRGGVVGEDMGSLDSSDPWASQASQEMAGHHPPGFSDPSDRYLSSDRAREISAGLDGGR
jgi:hypothetical protein